MTAPRLVPAAYSKLLAVNQRQADMIGVLDRSLAQANSSIVALKRANDDLRRRLEAHDMAQELLRVAEPDPLGNDWREA